MQFVENLLFFITPSFLKDKHKNIESNSDAALYALIRILCVEFCKVVRSRVDIVILISRNKDDDKSYEFAARF